MRPLETKDEKSRVVSSNVGEQSNFSIKIDGHIFKTLMDGMYSHKVPSVIREILANAFDAHIEAGNTTDPVRVFLPTFFNHTFRVRDYGPGMSHEFVMKLYTQLGHSEKRSSDDQTGMFGLGSKSPFSITDQFMVTVFDGTVKRVYSAYINDDGIPVLTHPRAISSGEPSGVEISIPVRRDDVGRFITAVKASAFAYFDKNIEFKNELRTHTDEDTGEAVDWGKNSFSLLAEDLYIANNVSPYGNRQVFVRQGFAVYPLNIDALGVTEKVRAFFQLAHRASGTLYLDVPIGTFSMTPSREGIQYDQTSITNLKTIITMMADDAADRVWAVVKNEKTIRDVYWALQRYATRPMNKEDGVLAGGESNIEFSFQLIRDRLEKKWGSKSRLSNHMSSAFQVTEEVNAIAKGATALFNKANNQDEKMPVLGFKLTVRNGTVYNDIADDGTKSTRASTGSSTMISGWHSQIYTRPTMLLCVVGQGTQNVEYRLTAYLNSLPQDERTKINGYTIFRTPSLYRDHLFQSVEALFGDVVYRTITDDDLPDVRPPKNYGARDARLKWDIYKYDFAKSEWGERESLPFDTKAYYVVRNAPEYNIRINERLRIDLAKNEFLNDHTDGRLKKLEALYKLQYTQVGDIARAALELELIEEDAEIIRLTVKQAEDLAAKDTEWRPLLHEIIPQLPKIYESLILPNIVGRPTSLFGPAFSPILNAFELINEGKITPTSCKPGVRDGIKLVAHLVEKYEPLAAMFMDALKERKTQDQKDDIAAAASLVDTLCSHIDISSFNASGDRGRIDKLLKELFPLTVSLPSTPTDERFGYHLLCYVQSVVDSVDLTRLEIFTNRHPTWRDACTKFRTDIISVAASL